MLDFDIKISKACGLKRLKEEIHSKTGESSKLLLYYCAIVKYMCLFFYQFTSYLPNQVSRWQFIVLESMVPLIAWHSAQTYPTLTAPVLSASGHLSVRDQNKRRNLADHQRATALVWTLRPRPRVQMITCLCFVNTLALRARHHCACKDVPGEARSLDDQSSFPKGKYSPSESESANNTCNTSSRYNFLLSICRFSLTNLTIYSHAMNWTASASMTR